MPTTQKEILDYVGEKQSVYDKKFAKIENGQISWNWCAFIVPGLWVLYRKMYGYFFILFALGCIASATATKFTDGGIYIIAEWIYPIGLSILAGLFADKLYYKRLKTFVENDDKAAVSEIERKKRNEKYGGTSISAIVILLVTGLLISSLGFYWT